MNKNKKLARKAVIARRAKKKQANKQETAKKDKRTVTRFFALIGCLLLVATLAVPCFADGTDYPVVSVDPYITVDGELVNLNGYYQVHIFSDEIDFSGLNDNETNNLFMNYVDSGYYKIVDHNNGIIRSGPFSLGEAYIVKANGDVELSIAYNGKVVYEIMDLENADIEMLFYFSVDPVELIDLQYGPWGAIPYTVSILEYNYVPNLLGTWKFNKFIELPTTTSYTVIFDSNGREFEYIQYHDGKLWYDNQNEGSVAVYDDEGAYYWLDEGYRTITIKSFDNDPAFATWLPANAERVSETDSNKITDVWANIMNWIITAISSVQSIFYAEGSLTLLGTLSVIGVGIALSFLAISVISRFLQLRG